MIDIRCICCAFHVAQIAVMPLGTGNDLARTLSWGAGFSKAMLKSKFLNSVANANFSVMDRWVAVIMYLLVLTEATAGSCSFGPWSPAPTSTFAATRRQQHKTDRQHRERQSNYNNLQTRIRNLMLLQRPVSQQRIHRQRGP